MSGHIQIAENKSWIVAGWVFRNVIDDTLPYVPKEACPHLLRAIEEGHGEGKLEYVDMSRVSVAERRVLLESLRKALNRRESEGDATFSEPSFYPGYIERFRELIAKVAADLDK